VRDHSDGQPVTLLEYEAYPSMAEKQMNRIMQGIGDEIPEVTLAAVHRVGSLRVGDLAVVCAASAPHRREALKACELLIDRIKESVPIWKREHGPNGPYWVGWQDARCGHSQASDCQHHHAPIDGHGNDAEAALGHGSPSGLGGLSIAVLTVSDTRAAANDESGKLACELLVNAGALISATAIVKDEPDQIRAQLLAWMRDLAPAAIVVSGGTGIAPRDHTIEAVVPMFSRVIDGFGEAFRRLSFEQVGARAVLSRALAGTLDRTIVFVLPGSPQAMRLGLSKLVIPVLPHAHVLIRGAVDPHDHLIRAAAP
jgi:molybdenum cofactor synthesis domain-containing protein